MYAIFAYIGVVSRVNVGIIILYYHIYIYIYIVEPLAGLTYEMILGVRGGVLVVQENFRLGKRWCKRRCLTICKCCQVRCQVNGCLGSEVVAVGANVTLKTTKHGAKTGAQCVSGTT